jgi:hypothetical protein
VKGNCKTTLLVALLLILILAREVIEIERELYGEFTCGSLTNSHSREGGC